MASSSHLKPGERGKIVAKIYSNGVIGGINKTVEVFSNDSKRPVVTLFLKAFSRAVTE